MVSLFVVRVPVWRRMKEKHQHDASGRKYEKPAKIAHLVGAENGNTGQLLNGSDTSDDGLVVCELLGTDGEGDGEDGRHSNGDTTDQEDKDVVKTSSVLVPETGVEDKDLGEDEDTDGDETEGSDLGQDLLQVTGGVVILTDEGGSATEKGVGTRRDDNGFGFTLFAGGSGVALVADLLGYGEGFTGEGGLVDGDVDGIVETAIGGNNVTDLEGDDITGDELGGFDFFPFTGTSDLGLGSD